MKVYAFALLLFVLALFGNPEAEAVETVLCDDCSLAQMKSKAIASLPDGGQIYIVDLEKNSVKGFRLYREPDMLIVQPTVVTEVVEEAVSQAKSARNLFENIKENGIDHLHLMPYMGSMGSYANNVYAVSRHKKYRKALTDAISQYVNDSLAGELSATVMALGLGFVNQIVKVEWTFTVNFPDGTSYSFQFLGLRFESGKEKPSLIVIPVGESGKDGVLYIPDDGNFSGYVVDVPADKDMRSLLDYMRIMGVRVTNETQDAGGKPIVIVCDTSRDCMVFPK